MKIRVYATPAFKGLMTTIVAFSLYMCPSHKTREMRIKFVRLAIKKFLQIK